MYGLNAVALVLFGCINALACRLCRCPKAIREKRMTAVCLTLLVWNMVRYGILFPMVEHRVRVPVEFSSVAYFVVPAIRLLSPKRFRSWAAYSGLMAGFFYYLAAVTLGGTLYQTYPTKEIYLSLLCHGAVYLCGFVALHRSLQRQRSAPPGIGGGAGGSLGGAASAGGGRQRTHADLRAHGRRLCKAAFAANGMELCAGFLLPGHGRACMAYDSGVFSEKPTAVPSLFRPAGGRIKQERRESAGS